MATANALVQTRIAANVRDRAIEVLDGLGLTVSDVVRIVLTRVANEGALPVGLVADSEAHDAWFRRGSVSRLRHRDLAAFPARLFIQPSRRHALAADAAAVGRAARRRVRVLAMAGLGMGAHIVADLFTPYGTMVFAPLSDVRYAWSPGRGRMPFRYGLCRAGGEWHAYELSDSGGRRQVN